MRVNRYSFFNYFEKLKQYLMTVKIVTITSLFFQRGGLKSFIGD